MFLTNATKVIFIFIRKCTTMLGMDTKFAKNYQIFHGMARNYALIGHLQAHSTVATVAHMPDFAKSTAARLWTDIRRSIWVHADQCHTVITADGGHIHYWLVRFFLVLNKNPVSGSSVFGYLIRAIFLKVLSQEFESNFRWCLMCNILSGNIVIPYFRLDHGRPNIR